MSLDDSLSTTRTVAPADPAALAHARRTVLDTAHGDVLQRARIVRHRNRRRALSIAATVGTAAALALVVTLPGDGPSPTPHGTPSTGPTSTGPVAAPPVVEVQYRNVSQIISTAATSSGQSTTQFGDAPYWKVTSQYTQSGENGGPDTSGKRIFWQGITGPGMLSDTFGAGIDATPDVLRMPKATLTVSGETRTWADLAANPLTAGQVRELLTAGELGTPAKPGRAPHEWYFFKQAGELLSETPASPALRQAIWKELTTLTGVTTTGKVTDAVGRTGWNLTYKAKGYGSQQFIVDPATGAILESVSTRKVRGSADTYRSTYLEAGPADSAPRPTQGQRMPS